MPDADAPLDADLALIEEAAREAGDIARRYFRRDPQVWQKDNDSPVSEADYAVDRFLAERLVGARPEYGWLSEETTDDPARLQRQTVFIVDPIDGTRAFVEGKEDWTVSIAIVSDKRPVAAALYAPIHEEMFLACAGSGTRMNGSAVHAAATDSAEHARLAGPWPLLKPVAARHPGFVNAGFIPSLAYRFAQVGDGRLDAALARKNAHDWDIAAADLLIAEAGGKLTDASGATILYNTPEIRHPPLLAAAPDLHDMLRRMIFEVPESNR